MTDPPRRAAPLPPDERRSAILAATVPLVRQYGAAVTTRQIAAAAGVAEGTLFRVFPDKDALVEAAICSAFAPEPLLAAIARVDARLPLEQRMLAIVRVLQQRLVETIELMAAVGLRRPPGPPDAKTGGAVRRPPPHAAFLAEVAELLEPDRDRLTSTPHEVARLLRIVTFAGTHAGINDGNPLTAEEIVSLVLDGVRRQGVASEMLQADDAYVGADATPERARHATAPQGGATLC